MHLLVTDRLACPRCGPAFGLVLFADELTERRVLAGRLGCANCRTSYPIEAGFGDLRPPPREEGRSTIREPATPDPEDAFRLAALLGVSEGPGLLLLTGAAAGHAGRLAAMIEEIEVVTSHPALRDAGEAPGVSRLRTGGRLPFFTASLRGVVLEGPVEEELVDEAIRVLAPGARLVVRDPGEGLAEGLEERGLVLLLQTAKAVVAARE